MRLDLYGRDLIIHNKISRTAGDHIPCFWAETKNKISVPALLGDGAGDINLIHIA